MVTDFDQQLATAICASISLPFVNLCRGKRLEYRKTETGDFSIRDHMFSEFIFVMTRNNEIEENIWMRNIRHAEIGELFLVYQPIVDINTRAILGAEALCRWFLRAGIISPLKFITIAEDNVLSMSWVIRLLKRQWVRIQFDFSQRASLKDDSYCILMFRLTLNEPHFHLRRLPPSWKMKIQKANSLCVEITETVIERINEHFYLNIEQLRKQGTDIDWWLWHRFCQKPETFLWINPDSIKVDSQFTIFSVQDGKTVHIIFDLARYNRIPVIAEGVRAKTLPRELIKLGCSGPKVSVPETHAILRTG